MRKIYIDCGVWEGDSILAFKKYFKGNYEIYGFECEPRLRQELKLLSVEENFTLIYKAVNNYNGIANLYPGINDYTQSSSIVSSKTTYIDKNHFLPVISIDFSQWIINNFEKDDFIICKMNIEGAEYSTLERMIYDGSISYINHLYVSWHNTKMAEFNQGRHWSLKEGLEKKTTLHNWLFDEKYKRNPFIGIEENE